MIVYSGFSGAGLLAKGAEINSGSSPEEAGMVMGPSPGSTTGVGAPASQPPPPIAAVPMYSSGRGDVSSKSSSLDTGTDLGAGTSVGVDVVPDRAMQPAAEGSGMGVLLPAVILFKLLF